MRMGHSTNESGNDRFRLVFVMLAKTVIALIALKALLLHPLTIDEILLLLPLLLT